MTGLVRSNDHSTSKGAASRVEKHLRKLQWDVLQFIRKNGPVTDEQITSHFDQYAESTARKRRTELAQMLYVESVGTQINWRNHTVNLWNVVPDRNQRMIERAASLLSSKWTSPEEDKSNADDPHADDHQSWADSILRKTSMSDLECEIFDLLKAKGPMIDEQIQKHFKHRFYGDSTVRTSRRALVIRGKVRSGKTALNSKQRSCLTWYVPEDRSSTNAFVSGHQAQ